MGNKLLAALLVFIGAVLFSAKAVMVKLVYDHHVDHVTLLMFRMLMALPVYVAILFIRKKKEQEEKIWSKNLLWVVLFGFLGYYMASYFDFLGLSYISAGLERVILFIYPTLVLIINAVAFKKKIQGVQVLAILLTYIGVIIAITNDQNVKDSEDLILGGLLIFFSALTYASYLVGSGWLIPRLGTIRFTCYAMVISTVCVTTHQLVRNPGLDLLSFPAEVYKLSLWMAIFSTVIPSFLISDGIRRLGASNAAIIAGVGPISTIVLASIYLDESFGMFQVIGTLLVITGVLLISVKGKKV